MKNKLNAKFLLSVFEKVTRHGEKHEQGALLEGVYVYTDHDGYTVFLEDAKVALSVGFHNQYHLDYQRQDDVEQFEKKLQHIDKCF